MQVSLHILDEKLVDLVVIGDVFGVGFLELAEQKHVLFALEQTRNLTRGEQRVHLLEEGGREAVGLIENETNLLLLHSSALHDVPQIFIEVLEGVVAASLDLEDTDVVEP
jgi:hypothetical protein